MKYQITQTTTDTILGVFDADSEQAALDLMARDAGYRDYADACDACPSGGDTLEITPIKFCWNDSENNQMIREATPVEIAVYLEQIDTAEGHVDGSTIAGDLPERCYIEGELPDLYQAAGIVARYEVDADMIGGSVDDVEPFCARLQVITGDWIKIIPVTSSNGAKSTTEIIGMELEPIWNQAL